MELYAAIDLHSNNSMLVVLDQDDHVIQPIGSASQITSEGWPQLQANLKLPVVLALSPMPWRFSHGWIS